MKDEELLAEVEDLLRTAPPKSAFTEQEDGGKSDQWLGRTAAVIKKWNVLHGVTVQSHITSLLGQFRMLDPDRPGRAYHELRTVLFEAQHDLQMKTVGPLSVAFGAEKPFAYFEEIRKLIEQAREDILFVDPYLDADFISRYLPQVEGDVMVRLLTSKEKLSSLLPAVEMFMLENPKSQVQVHSVSSVLHDRFVFVDKARCYQSGASFKDGAKKSVTTLTQTTDGFEAMQRTYEDMWDGADTKFPRPDLI